MDIHPFIPGPFDGPAGVQGEGKSRIYQVILMGGKKVLP